MGFDSLRTFFILIFDPTILSCPHNQQETNSVFSAAQITQIFTSAQDLDASLTAEQFSQHDVEMTFAEFNEAIACMSVWRDPNPYARVFCQAYCALLTFVQSILIVSHSQYSHVLSSRPPATRVYLPRW